VLKIRVDRVVKNIAAYIMLGITLEGKKEIIGIWITGKFAKATAIRYFW